MGLPIDTPAPPPSPRVIGNVFVEQYYHILHTSPELVFRFYQDSSILSRPDSNGVMTSVTTTQAINDMFLSLDYKNYTTEIETADSQLSYKEGVLVLVTGCLTGKDNVRQKFTQSFFLVPQDKGVYFVLNDVFRYVAESQPDETGLMLVNTTHDDAANMPLTSDPEPASVEDPHVVNPVIPLSEEDPNNGDEVCHTSETGGSVVEEEVLEDPPVHPCQNDVSLVSKGTASVAEQDAPKKSYASIVKVIKGRTTPMPVYVPTTKAKGTPVNLEKPLITSTLPTPAPETPTPSSSNVPGNNNSHEEEGYSIYIRNLPLDATTAQVEEEFKRFGPIKPSGIQVRTRKLERFCFGFVEFELLKSMQAAIEASPVTIGGHQAFIQEKRTTTRVVSGGSSNGTSSSGRGRFPVGRGGFRNDSFRVRETFSGNQGFPRTEFRNRSQYSSRGRGPAAGENYQRVLQNGNGRINHPSGMNQIAVSA